jgi:signal transduction histidine kinase
MLSSVLRPFSKTLGFRLTVWYSSLFIISSSILFGVAFLLISSTIQEHDHELVQAKIDEYTLMDRTEGLAALIHLIRMEEENNRDAGIFVRLADSNNKTLLSIVPLQWKTFDVYELETHPVTFSEEPSHGNSLNKSHPSFEIINRRLSDGSVLQVGKKHEKREKLLESFATIFAVILIPVVLIGVAGGLFLSFRALRPIRDLIHTVHRIDDGQLDARVPSSPTGDELEDLVRLFNRMLGRINVLITGMREALDNVAHDLRTPITRLRSVIETALQSESEAENLREALMDAAEEADRINTALSMLMDISEAEKGIMNLKLEKIDIVSLIREAAELYQYVAEDKGITLSTALPQTLAAVADLNRIRQVVANLVDNAIKFTPAGGRVEIEATAAGIGFMIQVRDSGIGIPAQDLPKIFDRLFRGEKSRSHRGLGLGLSMVQAVVRAHKGFIEVESHPDAGSIFRVTLPGLATKGPYESTC